MRAQVVIGGMFGDEGKGLMTDALAFRMLAEDGRCTVARFNGGAQAGHTVQRPDGTRHVFHHLGSGALAGAPTFLARHFVAHPMLFLQEHARVAALGGNTDVSIDPRALITTPYDIMLNQCIEHARGSGRHGSCGVGFGETIERSLVEDLRIRAVDLVDLRGVERTLDRIRLDYLPGRLIALGLPSDALDPWRLQEGIVDRYLHDLRAFFDLVRLRTTQDALGHGRVVFEGAQGLALDEELGHFPHVTRSMTGLPHVIDACREAGIDALDVHYGTRAYTTRHGAGPMAHEDGTPPPGFSDATNQPNAFQGALRFSPLQLSYLAELTQRDQARVDTTGMTLRVGAWISCLDQMGETAPIAGRGGVLATQLPQHVRQALSAQWVSSSFGPCREQVQVACPHDAVGHAAGALTSEGPA